MNRRQFIKTALSFGAGCWLFPAGCSFFRPPGRKKVIVLGIDGVDVHLTRRYMKEGLMPNFQTLMEKGSLVSIGTSEPPQSPVAWSSFSVGAWPSVHGIYDFIHRDPQTMIPYLSSCKIVPPGRTLDVGDYKIPLSHGHAQLLRRGRPFWEYLAERDIPTTVFKMPANFPCKSGKVKMVSGMGTPDLRGGYGSFTLYTTTPEQFSDDITGGMIVPVSFSNGRMKAQLSGPANTLKSGEPKAQIPIVVWRDANNPVVRIKVQDKELLLKEGEWSRWIQVTFSMLPVVFDVYGICKIFIKSVHPDFAMYVSPLNIDPSHPVLPVVSSKEYGQELVSNTGYFYTQGLPDDTKALSQGILSDGEYLKLAEQILEERIRLFEYELSRFNKLDSGLLFFYVSSIDQNTHMFWRLIDPEHPMYDNELHRHFGDTLKKFYARTDFILGRVMADYDIGNPDFALFLMSDHGFAPFRRQVNLNTWLYENGYMALKTERDMESAEFFSNVNWQKTGAYNLGINCVYLNLRGRERNGIVPKEQAEHLLKNLRTELLSLVDPATGQRAVTRVRIVPEEERQRHPHAPDMIVGWNRGYRNSWNSILGGFSPEVVEDNLDKWSGDHCIDPNMVPAILVTNKEVTKSNPNLCDITVTILEEFNIPKVGDMEGKPLYGL